ncbi:sodium-dependent transporter [Ileibacterium valens]|uniref:Transporter n=1 Tax=Ileibacterium valens TaxID=1862668 RepID=A0A1U7NHE1_9FIRM|nr:sodium-dependent transporter [Ileibacterium valens]OLU39304.1 sodium-dependent transporter [Erysipelotrichaceae bacterium NYU-BL-F16]OLU40858.1 sodium-dependent transporter [Erysipelotrichaceae bacterium NYU-BL-E8]OLU41149.1 sodium-dependent transporter [Ileibacterium valens]
MEREKLGSRLGFILLSAGCAIGIGNVWKFPYVAGQNGGAIFILIYLFFLVILGLPVMTMEFAMGRSAQKSVVQIYQKLTPNKKNWFWHGKAALAGNYLLMMFYTTVCGWMLKYFIDTCSGQFVGLNTEEVSSRFAEMIANPWSLIICMGIVVVAGFAVCAVGLQNGLERITKWMMLALLCIMVFMAINSVITPGSEEGIRFYLMPDFQKAEAVGWGNVIVNAMNQAFFTLSLGVGAMAIFGSYIEKDHSLLSESVNVACLDTFVAITAGLIIIPSCFAFQVEVTAGPSLIFITLPNIFNAMPLGRFWGSLFFVFMSFAAFSTVLAVFENIISATMDLTGWSRKKSCLINCGLVFVLSLPCALGFNVLSWIEPLKAGNTILDFEDFLVSNILLPLGSLIFVIYCTHSLGWGWDSFVKEANTGKGIKIPEWMKFYCAWILPAVILLLFIVGLMTYFQ